MDVLEFANADEWEVWLESHHGQVDEAWLRIGKRNTGLALIPIVDAGDVGLCFGWIDGQRKACDADSFLQRYSRRRAGSTWSRVNVVRAESLKAAGRMHPAGLQEIALARADGRWENAYESQRTAQIPVELLAVLAANPHAHAVFETLSRSEQYLLMLPLLKAYTAERKAAALARIIGRLARE
ncbi:OmdA domain containing protein [Arthrobacter alpinus]|uniref:YdeI/OmpD-associated family protein n=1 Tax=Arthrobacter alpinus TaxID=656366 RepID=UPI0005C85893|nr:YdeI/OmpD-associated family protein [Arthrobacter alpinus]ALV45642.1 OmdA domain containing protein [Arthrobacter alpinus]